MSKATPAQLEVMRFLARNYPAPCLFNELDQFSPQHPELITARRHVPAIRALYRKGWAKPWKNWKNWTSVMTEEGMQAFRQIQSTLGAEPSAQNQGIPMTNEHVIHQFRPDEAQDFPALAEVEMLLGGIGRLIYPDGTQQFADQDAQPMQVFSPRLPERELEAFCRANMARYTNHYELHQASIDNYETPAIEPFWQQGQA